MMTLSDAAVIQSSISDRAAFATTFDRHAASIHRFLARRVEPAEADGLLGDVFRIAFERREFFDQERSSARPWLYGIAANVVARHRRSEHRRLHAMVRLASTRIEDHHDLVGDRVPETIDAYEAWTQLVEIIDDLPAEERDALLLYAWEELSYGALHKAPPRCSSQAVGDCRRYRRGGRFTSRPLNGACGAPRGLFADRRRVLAAFSLVEA
jgi:DNA-directed RNA polymerase specialized sigma24 family protein